MDYNEVIRLHKPLYRTLRAGLFPGVDAKSFFLGCLAESDRRESEIKSRSEALRQYRERSLKTIEQAKKDGAPF